MNTLELVALGRKAQAALLASGGIARPLRAFPQAPYFEAGGEIVWIGQWLPARHPRAAVTAGPVGTGKILTFGAPPNSIWRHILPAMSADLPQQARAAAAALLTRICDLGRPRGFGALLCQAGLDFPLEFARDRIRTLAAAYTAGDIESVHSASRALLGLGAGLTPSGDDLVAAALFGRRLIDRDEAWARMGRALAHDALSASHAISAALLADTVAGESFEPLHELADALAADDENSALAAARALIRVGHASGWDMLAGCLLGILGERMVIDG